MNELLTLNELASELENTNPEQIKDVFDDEGVTEKALKILQERGKNKWEKQASSYIFFYTQKTLYFMAACTSRKK